MLRIDCSGKTRLSLYTPKFIMSWACINIIVIFKTIHITTIIIIIVVIIYCYDYADVRLVVHYSLPKTLEGFYQESGRAGRDGKPARSIVFYGLSDRDRMDWILSKQKCKGKKRKAGNQ